MFAALADDGILLLDEESEEADATAKQPLVIDLGGKIAVKRVVIRIFGSTKTNNLVEISKVEFLNDTENRIPEPEMDIPKNVQAKGSNKALP